MFEQNAPVILALGLAIGIAMAVIGLFLLLRPWLEGMFAQIITSYDNRFVFVLQWRPLTVNMLWVILAFICIVALLMGLLFGRSSGWPFGIVAAIVTGFIMVLVPLAVATPAFELSRRKRGRDIDNGLPGLLQQLSANLANNKNVGLALEEVSRTAPPPLDYELRLLAQKERDLGSLPMALDDAAERVKSDWFAVTAAVLKTTNERASSESEVLQNLSRVFAQQRAMRDRIDTATRQGETSMRIMLVVPFLVVAIAPFALPEATWDTADMGILWTVVTFGILLAFTAIGLAWYFKAQDI
ncbi:hypothetical protein AN189_18175 [Loktanella sp. 3ANDIMAR09]|uniref:type II secretion system F family protein n=1 Tax=Loktanella sp. 3ANDIMAR09 TaxID=1225657 RepID=UPI0006FD2256|nr:type II secretion system F family protein [Loktanella sp. 3ANDIMAR09]KQI66927.1 hypothetical protein AN189_18175 [Loktanella sp. 3ANDIMAR09]